MRLHRGITRIVRGVNGLGKRLSGEKGVSVCFCFYFL